MLREGCPLQVYCTDMVAQDLSTGFDIRDAGELGRWGGAPQGAADGRSFEVAGVPGLELTAVVLDGKAPPILAPARSPSGR